MGQMLLVTLREGIEMFLIVAIAATYLRKSGRAALLSAVGWGTATAVAASVVLEPGSPKSPSYRNGRPCWRWSPQCSSFRW